MNVLEVLPTPLKGVFLIEASAGTGKTETVSDIFLRLIVLDKRPVNEILVVTFTEAATDELKNRIIKRLRQGLDIIRNPLVKDDRLTPLFQNAGDPQDIKTRLNAALTCFDEAAIFTIHGFCHKILQENAFESGFLFDLELSSDQRMVIQEIVEDFWRIQTSRLPELFVRHLMGAGFSRSRERRGPGGLAAFALGVLNQPQLEVILPEGPANLSVLEAEVCLQYKQLSELWASGKIEIQTLLQGEEGLNRRSYPVASIPAWIEETDNFFSSADILTSWSCREKFCTESLGRACKKGFEPLRHSFFDLSSEFNLNLQKLTEGLDLNILFFKKELIDYLRHELVKRKAHLHIRSFDDLLTNLRDSLQGEQKSLARAIRKKFPVALVDEFQDTDQVQYQIFKTIYSTPDSLLFLIGDPKQAIYSFRGADIFTYMSAGRNARKILLDKNWRSAPKLVEAVNCLFEPHNNPFIFDDIRFMPTPAARAELGEALCEGGIPLVDPLQFWFFRRPEGAKAIDRKLADRIIPEAVAEEILTLLKKGKTGQVTLEGRPLDAADIAVIVRKNRETILIRDALREKGIPAVIHSSESLFASTEAQAVLKLIKGISDPANDRLVRTALASHLFEKDWSKLFELFENEAQWELWIEKFHDWHRIWQERGFIAMAGSLMSQEKIRERLLGCPDGERQLTNLIHCFEILHTTAVQKHLGIKSLVTWFSRQIEDCPEKEEYQIRLETDRKAVNVITIHRSKGLGFPIVFCPYSWFGIRSDSQSVFFHDPGRDNRFCFDMGSTSLEEHKKIMEKEILSENMRLLYVALTRAKHRCYLAWGAFKGAETSSLSYLFHARQPVSQHSLDGVFPDFAKVCDQVLLADIEKRTARSKGSIHVTEPPESYSDSFDQGINVPGSLEVTPFSGRIDPGWEISSFSSLTFGKNTANDLSDYLDEIYEKETPPAFDMEPDVLGAPNIRSFPRGAKAGLCFHSILEKMDFCCKERAVWKDLTRQQLQHYRFDESSWVEPVFNMLENVFSIPLTPFERPFFLADIRPDKRLSEMEFFFPMNDVSAFRLAEIFAAENSQDISETFMRRLKNLSSHQISGFLKGFIDLVFEHEGRFFLVDWKSNFLGDRPENYSRERIQEVMDGELYHLQYHLYCLAMHKYLRTRISDYDYEKHFGAVFYLFLRGVDPAAGSEYGVYQTRPSAQLIENLELFFKGN
jgi:exodeoxyribonuclease V beta subunit